MLCDREDIILKITEFGEEYFGGGGSAFGWLGTLNILIPGILVNVRTKSLPIQGVYWELHNLLGSP